MENGQKSRNFLGWTPEDYEMMTDTCPIHYVQSMMEEHEITKADREVQMVRGEIINKWNSRFPAEVCKARESSKTGGCQATSKEFGKKAGTREAIVKCKESETGEYIREKC